MVTVLLGIVLIALVGGGIASGLGALVGIGLGVFGLHRDRRAARQAAGHPMRSRTFEEIQAAKNGGMYKPDARFK